MSAAPREPILLLDGAVGTELDRRGVDISLPLWSARALLEAPDVLAQVHRDYLEAGAGAITTCTFRTHERSLAKASLGERAEELTTLAVRLARAARDEVKPDALVLGSVAPLEDCYKPELAADIETCEREHRQIMSHLLAASVDMLLIETMNNLHEAAAAARMAQELAPGQWMMSFCTKSDGPPNVLISGEPLIDLVPSLGEAWAVGVNCVAAPAIETQVKLLRMLVPETVRIAAYANVGHADDDGRWVHTDAIDPTRYAEYASSWIHAGATIVGGCCGTTPQMISEIAGRLPAG